MMDSADERSKVDRTKDPEDPTRDAREEYTSYRNEDPDRTAEKERDPGRKKSREKRDEEALREAELQPGRPDEGRR